MWHEPKHLIIILCIHIYINPYKHKNLSVVNIWNISKKLVIYGEVSKSNNYITNLQYNKSNKHLTFFDRFTIRTNMQIEYFNIQNYKRVL